MKLFDALGFRWGRSAVPTSVRSYSLERACFRFHKMLPEFVWDASMLEGARQVAPCVLYAIQNRLCL